MDSDRPYVAPYPDSLIKYIMDYHKLYSNSLRLAVEVSQHEAGGFAKQLAPYFGHVHTHTFHPANGEAARNLLSMHHGQHWEQATFTLSTGPVDGMQYAVAKRSVDLLVMTDSEPWTTSTRVLEIVAEMLSPSGSLVIMQTCHWPVIRGNERANKSFQILQNQMKEMVPIPRQLGLNGALQLNSGLDHFRLPLETWSHKITQRVGINARPVEDEIFTTLILPTPPSRLSSAHTETQILCEYRDCDVEAKGWTTEVDTVWFRDCFLPGFLNGAKGRAQTFEPQLKQLEADLADRACPGSITLLWSCTLLLTIRRQ